MKYTWEELIAIEKILNRITFSGIPVGGLFANFLYPRFFFHEYDNSKHRKYLLDLISLKENLKAKRKGAFPNTDKNIRFIFNFTSNNSKLTGFFKPVIELLDAERVLLVSGKDQEFKFREKDGFIYPQNLTTESYAFWKSNFSTTLGQFMNIVPELRQFNGCNNTVISELKIVLEKQTRNLTWFHNLLSDSNVSGVITDHDRQMINSSLILAAKLKNIPTFTFIHGSTDPAADFIPLLADYMFCWGHYHYKQFSELGVPESKLLITGNPKITDKSESENIRIKKKLSISDKLVIIFAANPIDNHEKLQLCEIFCKAVSSDLNYTGIVKLHPSETKTDYNLLIDKYPNIRFLGHEELNAEESLNIADIIACHNSTLAIDALIKKIPVMILNPSFITFPIGAGIEIHEKAGCPYSINESEFKSALILMQSESYRSKAVRKSRTYAENYCLKTGSDSAKLITEILKSKTQN